MNTGALLTAIVIFPVALIGQGRFTFNNFAPPEIDAPMRLPTDAPGFSRLSGDAYTVQLLGGPVGSSVSQLIALGTTNFKTGAAAGYVNPLTVAVPGVPGGGEAIVLVTLNLGSGPSATRLGTFGPFMVTVTEPPDPTPNLPLGLNPFPTSAVPEPIPLLSGLLGLGMVSYLLRAKNREPALADPFSDRRASVIPSIEP